MNSHQYFWRAIKTAIHPFRRVLARHLERRHVRFDLQTGVNTAGRVTLLELGLSSEKSIGYEATPIRFFHSVLGKLSLDYPRTIFIDLGCGKGRTLLLASNYAFSSIIGVEISEALCRIAVANINAYSKVHTALPPISVVHCAIGEYKYDRIGKSCHLLVYMFNPCSESQLSASLEQLSRLTAQGALITIIYLNPTWVQLLTNAPWLTRIFSGETFDEIGRCFMPYVVFRSLSPEWQSCESGAEVLVPRSVRDARR
jgi:hypothetical protein